jgi:hypothetical protein
MLLVIEMLSRRLKSTASHHCALFDAGRPGRRGLADRSPPRTVKPLQQNDFVFVEF